MQDPKIVLLIFVSGKVVLTGAKKREDIYRAFENIYPVLQTFRKGGRRGVGWRRAVARSPAAPLPCAHHRGSPAPPPPPPGGMLGAAPLAELPAPQQEQQQQLALPAAQ